MKIAAGTIPTSSFRFSHSSLDFWRLGSLQRSDTKASPVSFSGGDFLKTTSVTQQHVHPAAIEPEMLLADCDVRRSRRSGPGGQHRNKVETAVTILHRPSGIIGEATERRSQAQNRSKAIARLRLNLALELRRPVESDSAPSEHWRWRCRGGRVSVNASHDLFPTLLAEALDFVRATGWDVKAAAGRLGSTSSQLVKFLKIEPRAIGLINVQRQAHGLRPLK